MNETKLKPCPFCGGKAELMKPQLFGGYRVRCQLCNTASKPMPAYHEAAALWNRRTEHSEHSAHIEEPIYLKLAGALIRAASQKVFISGGSICLLAMVHKDGDFSLGLYPYEPEQEGDD